MDKKENFNKINCKSIKTNKIASSFINSENNIVNNKIYVGYKNEDYDMVDYINKNDFGISVKTDALFNSNLVVNKQVFFGYEHSVTEKLNNDTVLHINGDTEINGDIYVYNDINTDKSINVEKSINIGFDCELNGIDEKSKLNVNGDSELVGNVNIYGEITINNNLTVNENANFNKNININNNLILKSETIANLGIIDNCISLQSFKKLLKNILKSVKDKNFTTDSCAINFLYNDKSVLNTSILSVTKKIIIENNIEINCYSLIYAISNKKNIICCKPILDTFFIINSENELIDINDDYILNKNNEHKNNINKKSKKGVENIRNKDSNESEKSKEGDDSKESTKFNNDSNTETSVTDIEINNFEIIN